MKKTCSLIFGFVVFVSALLISFLPAKNNAKNQADASYSIEQKFYDSSTIELVSKNPISFVGASADKTPFDSETMERMEGRSITPNADDYGQVKNYSYSICSGNGYTPEVDDNIFLWVYLIDALTFKLEISLEDTTLNKLTWEFDSQETYVIGTGWKLLALKLSDHETEINKGLKTYRTINFKYLSEASELEGGENYESYLNKTTERFSFYHIFSSKNANLIKKSGKIYGLERGFYKFSEKFDIGSSAFVGDKFIIDAPSEIFEYLYVGKNDLSDYLSSGKYFWELSIKMPDSTNATLDFGDTVNFYKKGFYYINIQMFERLLTENKLVMNVGHNVFVDELSLGKFRMGPDFSIKDDEKIVVELTLSDALVDIDKLVVSLNNNNAEIESYYEKDGVLYVCLIGKANGTSSLEISAEAKSKYSDITQTFSSVAIINVDYTDDGADFFMIILWVLFGSFCLGIIIYLSISVVKARKNGVR